MRDSTLSIALRDAVPADASLVARLHVQSWRTAYADILSPGYLAGPIEADRQGLWTQRLGAARAAQRVTLAFVEGEPAAFVCTFAGEDPRWGSLVDNLHVLPAAKGQGVGASLLRSAAAWVCAVAPGQALHLWVYEANTPARAFYERMGGEAVERDVDGAMPGGGAAAAIRYAWREPGRMLD